ncbi:tRNA (adenosine(37)-N6)-dimethylallyltransferase MiaA [Chloroflexota bacterium]
MSTVKEGYNSKNNLLVAVIGPTATGKSKLAIQLAQRFDGEIVSADSRQVYRHMDIGTAKSSPDELILIPQHIVDIINPDEEFSLAQYQQMAYQAIGNIQQHQQLPLLVGGSGLYVWAVLEGWKIPEVAPDLEFRQKLEEREARGEAGKLYRELEKTDPTAARRIDPRNVRRVIRALEVSRNGRASMSQLQGKETPPFDILIIGLTTERTELYRRIDRRVDKMIEQGLVEEVKKLVDMGFNMDLPAMSGIGYKQIGAFLKGELTLESAIGQIKTETHRFVRRQYNWFRLTDDRIKWFDITNDFESEVAELVNRFISK